MEETCSSIEPPSDVDTDLGPQEDPAEERDREEEEDEGEDDVVDKSELNWISDAPTLSALNLNFNWLGLIIPVSSISG